MEEGLPFAVHVNEAHHADQGVAHQSHSSALRRAVEECNLDLVLLKRVSKVHCCFPCVFVNAELEILDVDDVCSVAAVDTDFIGILELEARLVVWTEVSARRLVLLNGVD